MAKCRSKTREGVLNEGIPVGTAIPPSLLARPSHFVFRVSPFPFPFKCLPRRLLWQLILKAVQYYGTNKLTLTCFCLLLFRFLFWCSWTSYEWSSSIRENRSILFFNFFLLFLFNFFLMSPMSVVFIFIHTHNYCTSSLFILQEIPADLASFLRICLTSDATKR